jgi:hypothetical protein
MTSLPSFPTDSLYKFIALFGIVLFAFGAWYPEQKFRTASAAMRETLKQDDLGRIKVERKKEQVDRISKELGAKSDALVEKQAQLEQARAYLIDKNKELESKLAKLTELAKLTKNVKEKELVDLTAQYEAVNRELEQHVAKVREHTEEVKTLTAERNALLPQQEEVIDELKAQTIINKRSTEALESLNAQALSWLVMQWGSCLVGIVLIFLGFILWYRKVQRYQDAMLRKQAALD